MLEYLKITMMKDIMFYVSFYVKDIMSQTRLFSCKAFTHAATSLAKNSACSVECNDIPTFTEYVYACYKCELYEALGAITASAVSASFIVPAPNLWVSDSPADEIFLDSSVYKRLDNLTQSRLTLSFLQLYRWIKQA